MNSRIACCTRLIGYRSRVCTSSSAPATRPPTCERTPCRFRPPKAPEPALIVVDHMQLLKDEEGAGRMRERNVSAAARGLKDVSGELGLPLLGLVQLNRNRATRACDRDAGPSDSMRARFSRRNGARSR